jgi:hypothetical protein
VVALAGERATAECKSIERAGAGESGVGELSLCTHTRDKDGRSMWDNGDWQCIVTAMSPRATDTAG